MKNQFLTPKANSWNHEVSLLFSFIHPSICVHNCSHRNMYLFLFPIWVWKLIFFCSFVFSWWLIILVTIVSVAMVKFLATGKFAMDPQISIVYHFLSLEHVVQYIHAEEPEMIKISKKTLVRSKVRKRFRNQKPISNIEIYCLKYFRLFRQTEPKPECKELFTFGPKSSKENRKYNDS